MQNTLKHRAISSGSWVIFGHLTAQGLRLISNLVLTRVLVPEMFGVMAIINVVIMGVGMFSDIGLQQNIVNSKRAHQDQYQDTAWTIQILRGIVIMLVILGISCLMRYLATEGMLGKGVYADEQLPNLLACMAVVPLVSGFRSVNWLLLNRNLMMTKVVLIEISAQLISIMVMVLFALTTGSIWSLVIGGIVAPLLVTFASHHPALGKRAKISWESESAHEIIHFGKWIFLSSILGFLLSNGDRLLLGMWVSSELLGLYTVGSFIATALKSLVIKVTNSVFYPVLSEVIRERPNEVKKIYYNIRLKVDLVTMFFSGIFLSCGHHFIDFLYDERYSAAGQIFELLSLSLLFVGYGMAGTCLMAYGSSKANALLIFIATTFLYVTVPLGFFYGGFDTALVMIAINYIIDIPVTFYLLHKVKVLDLIKEVRALPVFLMAYLLGQFVQRSVIPNVF